MKKAAYRLLGGLALAQCAAWPAHGGNEAWTVSLLASERGRLLTVSNATLAATVSEPVFWTLTEIRYQGTLLVGSRGANGAVANVKHTQADGSVSNLWIGTGHGLETLRAFSVEVDGRPCELREGMAVAGRAVTLTKRSTLGLLDQTAVIQFPDSGDRLIERHRFTVNTTPAQSLNFLYAYMHCNENALTEWRAWTASDAILTGSCTGDDNTFHLKQDVRAVSFFAPSLGLGLSYIFPEVYPGKRIRNAIWDRPHDNKLYFTPDIPEVPAVGAGYDYAVTVMPFQSTLEAWAARSAP